MKNLNSMATLAVLVSCMLLAACDTKYCPNGTVAHISQACPIIAPAMQRKLEAQRVAEEQKAVARTQHRLSETAPPQSVSGDQTLRDPALRRHIARENSQVHP
jgi:hypothetical protein